MAINTAGASQQNDAKNYFGLAVVQGSAAGGALNAQMGLTVQQAYNIDAKIDDGLPQSGSVMALYTSGLFWASSNTNIFTGGGLTNDTMINPSDFSLEPVTNPATAQGDTGDSSTCYDAGKANTLPVTYSTGGNKSPNNSALINCVLSFKFQ